MKRIIFLLLISVQFSYSQWESCNNGITNLDATCLAVSGNNIFAGTYGAGLFFSADSGNTWTQRNSGLSCLNVRSMVVSGNYIFVGTSDTNGGIFRSTDNGNSWVLKTDNDPIDVVSLAANGNMIAAGAGSGLFISSDYGNNWIKKTNVPYTISLFLNDSNIYAGTYRGFFISTNDGENWLEFDKFKKHEIYAVLINNNVIYVGSSGYQSSQGYVYSGLYLSTDNGSNWQYKLTWQDSLGTAYSIFYFDNKIFVGGQNFVNYSTDNGNSWSPENNGIPDSVHSTVYSMMTNGYYLYAATYSGEPNTWPGAGVFRIKMSDFAAVFEKNSIPDYFLLPNPTGSFARIRYNSPVNSDVSFSVTSLVGVKVKETPKILNQSAGEQICELDTSGLPSGAYFVTMMSGGTALTKQLIVIK